ncbi:peptidoglycan-binding domain-containing protein [Thiocystis violacea]|uniref:peptidoglycan-binding domain-containing protein n=1 Tax=Thiocystis violacea TaxID=13725 RepID=UPI0019051402|nr:hypothetical protein [Thiocystis violacea]MBK1719230.1 hypothetical protein [Thiocystis violacea]
MTRDQIIRAQQAINDAGLGPVVIDGVYGPITATAYAELLRRSTVAGVGAETPAPPAAKPWWTSRAQVGWLLTIALQLLSRTTGMEIDHEVAIPAVLDVLSGFTALLAVWGSTKRAAPIDQTLVLPGVRLSARGLRRESLPPDADAPGGADGFWGRAGGPLDPD